MRVPWPYDWGIALYTGGIRAAAAVSPKARAWAQGRRHWAARLEEAVQKHFPPGAPRIWIHCASLGEFEQGRPIIEALRRECPQARILLSFFSPSGFEIRKDYPLADHVCYLPADTRAQAERFVEIVKPDLAIFVKYEFWLHTLKALAQHDIPAVLVSALFRPGQVFFRWYGRPWMQALRRFRRIFVQDAASASLLEANGISHGVVAGDTRVDRVLALAEEQRHIPVVEAFCGQSPVWVAGSTWPPDEELIAGLLKKGFPQDWKLIAAPHEVSEKSLKRLEDTLRVPSLRFSATTPETAAAARVLIIDNVGMLAALYRYAKVAYIGGGFGPGIHNTLEPMAFGLPVIFGPKYSKFREAVEMVRQGGAMSVNTEAELRRAFAHFSNVEGQSHARLASSRYLEANQGATEQVVKWVKRFLIC